MVGVSLSSTMECFQEKISKGDGKDGCWHSSDYPIGEAWTTEEDKLLINAVQSFKERNWKEIAKHVPGRTYLQCRSRWYRVIDPKTIKGRWTKQEDAMIIKMVKEFGPQNWSRIAKSIPGRVGKQCRERWVGHLAPSVRKEKWTEEENMRLLQAYAIYGSSWSKIRKFLPGRAANAIKGHWRSIPMLELRNTYKANGLDGNLISCSSVTEYTDTDNFMQISGLLGDSMSYVPATIYSERGNCRQNKNSMATSEAQALTSDHTIDGVCNSTHADDLTDIDMIVCGSPLRVGIMSGEDDDG